MVRIAQGDVEAASRWVEERNLDGSGEAFDSVPLLRALEYIVLAQVRVAQGRPEEALEVLRPLRQRAENANWVAFAIRILIAESLALQAQGHIDQAMISLARALSLAEAGGFAQVFVDEGAPMSELLRQAAARGIEADYAGKLLAAIKSQAWRSKISDREAAQRNLKPETLIEPLTERELEVLRLLSTSLSSTEMAEELFISVNTVRSHIRTIYSKLDVHSRYEAVARARELNLL
jgi:LuxR family maltose regulon positive regulatory protein